MEFYRYKPGTVPVVVSIPHAGTHVPQAILNRFTAEAKRLPDTDWHVEKLYDFAGELGIHVLAATHSRYVIDLNRAPDNTSLYPGKFTTGLCPLTLFNGTSLYIPGEEPSPEEIIGRTERYWKPYHQHLKELLSRLKEKHGRVILFDAHSIRSHVPSLFDGQLPDLNLGTADGASMNQALSGKLLDACAQSPYSYVHNGRFKGGYITRNYGNPETGIEAVQLELTQINYMDEDQFTYDAVKATKLQTTLRSLVQLLVKDTAR